MNPFISNVRPPKNLPSRRWIHQQINICHRLLLMFVILAFRFECGADIPRCRPPVEYNRHGLRPKAEKERLKNMIDKQASRLFSTSLFEQNFPIIQSVSCLEVSFFKALYA